MWYGGLVVEDDTLCDKGWLIAFDDGEMRYYTEEKLKKRIKLETLAEADAKEEGIIANEAGHWMAEKVGQWCQWCQSSQLLIS